MHNTTIKLHTISIPHCAQTKKQQKAFSFKYDEKIQTKKQRSSVLVPLRIIQIFSAVLLQFIEISRLQIIDIQSINSSDDRYEQFLVLIEIGQRRSMSKRWC